MTSDLCATPRRVLIGVMVAKRQPGPDWLSRKTTGYRGGCCREGKVYPGRQLSGPDGLLPLNVVDKASQGPGLQLGDPW